MKVKINRDFETLIPNYLKKRNQDLQLIDEAIQSGTFDLISEIGHKLKGNGASYGFLKLSELGSQLEVAGGQGNIDAIKSLRKDLSDFLQHLEIEFIDPENK